MVVFLKFIRVRQVQWSFAAAVLLRLNGVGVCKLILKMVIDFLHRVQVGSAAPIVLQEFVSKLFFPLIQMTHLKVNVGAACLSCIDHGSDSLLLVKKREVHSIMILSLKV